MIVALSALEFCGPLHGQAVEIVDHASLRVCADPDALPFSAEDGSGYENRIAELFASSLGVPVRYTWFPNAMGFYRRTLNARRCDIVIGAASDSELAQSTKPYYRSTFALLSRSADGLHIGSLDDPALKGKRIGVQARTPVADLIASNGQGEIHAYNLMVDSRVTSIGKQMADDLVANKIDVAVVWGPVAAYQRRLHPDALSMTVLGSSEQGVPLAFDIAMAVRRGEPQWKARVDQFIDSHRSQISAILKEAEVPVLAPEDEPAS